MQFFKTYLSSPFAQIGVLAVLVAFVFLLTSTESVVQPKDWTFAAAFLLVYMIMNPIIGLAAKKWKRYLGLSFLCFFILLLVVIALGQSVSSVSLRDIVEFQMIFAVLSLCYFILVFISFLIRAVGKQLEG